MDEKNREDRIIERLDKEIELLGLMLEQLKTSEGRLVRFVNFAASIAGILGIVSVVKDILGG